MKIQFLWIAILQCAVAVAHDDGDDDMGMQMPDNHDQAGLRPESVPTSPSNTEIGVAGHNDSLPASPADHKHGGMPILQNPKLTPEQRKFWEQYDTTTFFSSPKGQKPLLYMHAILSVITFGVLWPLSFLMSTDPTTQWFYVPLQSVTSLCGVIVVILLLLYSATAPKLYPGNAYSPYSALILILITIHWVSMIGKALGLNSENEDLASYMMADFEGQEVRNNTLEFADDGQLHENAEDPFRDEVESPLVDASFQKSSFVQRLAKNTLVMRVVKMLGSFSSVLFNMTNIPLLLLGYGYLLLGTATGFRLGLGRYVYSLLAHFIKGFVFFLLGFVELARYFGALSQYGMAWNVQEIPSVKVSAQRKNRGRLSWLRFWPENPTMEYWQSFLIFVYGITNVGLEHLGNEDGKWSHKDMQHASIAFMFIGGGLSGLILEYKKVRELMSFGFGFNYDRTAVETHRSWSLNPMPAITVFWTGALMSRHEQETRLSTDIHIQWGTMLSAAGVFRFLTYCLLYTRSLPANNSPQRPVSELVVCFLLICGGLVFMESNRETVFAMMYRGIDSMFTLNVSVGLCALFMALATLMFSIKGWASSRYRGPV